MKIFLTLAKTSILSHDDGDTYFLFLILDSPVTLAGSSPSQHHLSNADGSRSRLRKDLCISMAFDYSTCTDYSRFSLAVTYAIVSLSILSRNIGDTYFLFIFSDSPVTLDGPSPSQHYLSNADGPWPRLPQEPISMASDNATSINYSLWLGLTIQWHSVYFFIILDNSVISAGSSSY